MVKRGYYEFFAGGGMARLGLGHGWQCLFANDIDEKKAESYRANFGGAELKCADIGTLAASDLPGVAELAWASFPCQDLSLAGSRGGLNAARSGTFWGFWQQIHSLKQSGRAPRLLVLENVCGALTSNNGQDFHELARALSALDYRFGALIIDAADFLPQSRPRLFIVCIRRGEAIPAGLAGPAALPQWSSAALERAHETLAPDLRAQWLWWQMPPAPKRNGHLKQLVETSAAWHTPSETARLLGMMSAANLAKVEAAKASGHRVIGTIYKRTRPDADGFRQQRAEVRFDGLSGCLRTPGGGSSRQTIIQVDGAAVRTRLITVREAARLMGVPDTYKLPPNYNDGYHLFGDGLAVPAVAYLRANLLDRLLGADCNARCAA